MRFCEQGELYDKIKEKKGFDEFTTAHLMKQLLSVVFYCHSNSIINRDLRPENILIESEETVSFDGNDTTIYNIRISDFKSARTFKTSKKLNKKVGNPYYIAPEVLKRKYNEKCDLWSCGIIMYVLLTGKPPFAGSTDKEVLEKVEGGIFEFFEKDMGKFSNECKQLLKDLTKYDPSKRPTAGEALKHKWFKGVNTLRQNSIHQATLITSFNNMLNFSPDFRFQQATFAYMIHHLTEQEEIKEIRKIFEAFDTNNDGKLSHEEILEGFKLIIKNFNKNEKDLAKALKRIDQDKSGTIEYEEFIRATIDKREFITDEKIRIVFNLFKNAKSECITPSELKIILGLASKQFSDKAWNDIIMQIFKECDENKDNEINLEEFNTMMMKLVI